MPHAPDLSGRALDGRYELHAVIGEGTFGRVYRGRDQRLARAVAVKVIKPWWAEDPDWVRRFELEAQLLARLNAPGIVQIFDVGHADEGLYYVAELVDGESLADRVKRGPLSAEEAREIAEQLCRALARAHAQDVIHRDVKPANVLLSTRGEVKVGDFGVAALAEGSTDAGGATVVGTPRYMAPEQARGGRTGPATDVYGAGIVLYEMLAGHPPFRDGSPVELALRHLHDPPPPLPADTPPALAATVERALAKRPEDRYRSASAMADALAKHDPASAATTRLTPRPQAARSTPRPEAATALLERAAPEAATRVRAPTVPKREPPPKPRRRTPARVALATIAPGAALVIAVVAIGLVGGKNHVKVPNLRGENRTEVTAQLRHLGLRAIFHGHYSSAKLGSTIAQRPRAGVKLTTGSTVRVTLSDGPPPVPVPQLVGQSQSQATTLLAKLGLHASVTDVAAPGVSPGVVTHQSPAASADAPAASTVKLQVAEQPRWRALTAFSGHARGHSVAFRILGSQWRIVYSMHYQGLCTLIFFCSGPNARVFRPTGNVTVGGLNLSTGSDQTRVFALGPGVYEIAVTPGSDTAAWSIQVEDYY